MTLLRHWIYLCSLFAIYTFSYGVADSGLWCEQCSWSNVDTYTTNGTNTTGDPLCIIANLDDITAFDPNPTSPKVNPLCTYEESAYERLLEGPCYDYACYAQGGKACIKWTIYKDSKLMNITRLCAVVGNEKGCYHQDYGDGYYKEVCICDDQHFCNAAWTTHGGYKAVWFLIGIFLMLRWFSEF